MKLFFVYPINRTNNKSQKHQNQKQQNQKEMSKKHIVYQISLKINHLTNIPFSEKNEEKKEIGKNIMDTTCLYRLFIWLHPNFRMTIINRLNAPDFGGQYTQEQKTEWLNKINDVSKITYQEFGAYWEIPLKTNIDVDAKLEKQENRDDDLLPEEIFNYLESWQYSRINCFRKHYSNQEFEKIYKSLVKENPKIALEFALYHIWSRLSDPKLQTWCEENCEPGNQYASWLYNFSNLTIDEINTWNGSSTA